MKEMSRVEQYEFIRRDARDKGLSIRALAGKHKVHRRTVRQALEDPTPPTRKVPDRVAPALGPYIATIRGWLVDDQSAPRKQRHTARRVWQRLVDEEGAEVAESSVRALVAQLRYEIGVKQGEVCVPQTHLPAEEAEVDFGEFAARIAGSTMRVWMFVLRLSHSGKAVHVAYANQSQESFLDGHVQAFDRLGGVPTGMIRYDNLKPAVTKVALGRERLENPRFIAMRSHYGFDSFFCIPGIDGAHEKGGVEGEVGRFRRRHLVPLPVFASLAELNQYMAKADAADDYRHINARAETVKTAAARELPILRPLPEAGSFDVAAQLSCRVDAKARICVRQSWYSVPARFAGRRLQVRLGAFTITAVVDGKVVAEHVRSVHKFTETLELDHYLEVLGRKPGALPGATALVQARTADTFTPIHQKFWDGARAAAGDQHGTKAMIEVLLLHRTLPAAAIRVGMIQALVLGNFDPELVAVEARRHQQQHDTVAVLVLPERVAVDLRPTPTLASYDQLIHGART